MCPADHPDVVVRPVDDLNVHPSRLAWADLAQINHPGPDGNPFAAQVGEGGLNRPELPGAGQGECREEEANRRRTRQGMESAPPKVGPTVLAKGSPVGPPQQQGR